MSINVVCILLVAASTSCSFVDAVPIMSRAGPYAKSQYWTGSSTTLATFNTALIPLYPELKTRTDIIIQKVADLFLNGYI